MHERQSKHESSTNGSMQEERDLVFSGLTKSLTKTVMLHERHGQANHQGADSE